MNNKFINDLAKELQKPLPGKKAQNLMAPGSRDLFNIKVSDATTNSSILIPIFVKNNKFHTVLFKRPDHVGKHAGQVCFPGGKLEPVDKTLEDTALREAWEEIGIDRQKIKILGGLTPLHIPVSDFLVQPFVGFLDDEPELKPDPSEVGEIIMTSLISLLDPQNIKKKTVIYHGHDVIIPYYLIQNFEIWGATAMIISELVDILQRLSY